MQEDNICFDIDAMNAEDMNVEFADDNDMNDNDRSNRNGKNNGVCVIEMRPNDREFSSVLDIAEMCKVRYPINSDVFLYYSIVYNIVERANLFPIRLAV